MDTKLDINRIRFDEKLALSLRSIYEGYGYVPYKMSKFEEYELYARNKDFLGDGGILTFTDVSGRLMALKPDVTLSIVKNSKGSVGTQKVYYRENVYRTSRNNGGFKEIQQSGIECIGDILDYDIVEVLLLALKSLKATGKPFKLEISHMGIMSALIDGISLSDNDRAELFTCIKRKNSDGIVEILSSCGYKNVPLAEAIALNGDSEYVISELRKICPESASDAINSLEKIVSELNKLGYSDNVGIDLSIVNDMKYYRSLVFRGYIDCIPEGVLFGGRYDDLVKKMGRNCSAVGFAVSLDKLAELSRGVDLTYRDILLVYDDTVAPSAVIQAVDSIRSRGQTVVALNYEDKLNTYGKILYLTTEGIVFDKGDQQ